MGPMRAGPRCSGYLVWLFLAASAAAWGQSAGAVQLTVRGEHISPGRIFLFSDVAVGAASAPVAFTLTNRGSSSITLARSAVILSGNDAPMFSVVNQPESTLSSGGSLRFRLVFEPTRLGPFLAKVTVRAVGRPQLFSFVVAGNGVPSL